MPNKKNTSKSDIYDNKCFVISPIGSSDSEVRKRADLVFEAIIKPAAEENGLVAERADMRGEPGIITNMIIQEILRARIVVADLSGSNPNVFYELALRHAFMKPYVQIIVEGEKIPFDLQGVNTIQYGIDLQGGTKAKQLLSKQIQTALSPSHIVESPVTIAASLLDAKNKGAKSIEKILLNTLNDKFNHVEKKITDLKGSISSNISCPVRNGGPLLTEVEELIGKYAKEISLLNNLKDAGIINVYNKRELALKEFETYIDEEDREVTIIGSSLSGLLLKEESENIKNALQFKVNDAKLRLKILLTHPVVADLRAGQENRDFTKIGEEIIEVLKILKNWNKDRCIVRLYLGTPTCFAIKTTDKMLINPYPYVSVSYDSPCLVLKKSTQTTPSVKNYFFEEFNSRHFRAFESNFAVPIDDFDKTIMHLENNLIPYSKAIEKIIQEGKNVI